MKQLNASEMNAVVGGRWRCGCGKKTLLLASILVHQAVDGHILKGYKWCW